jgi:hypothetical protein
MLLAIVPSVAQLPAQPELTSQEKELVSAFNNRVKTYVKQRNGVKEKLPKLPKESTSQQIQAYQVSFAEAVRAVRATASKGLIFDSATAEYIRATIKKEFKGSDRAELRKTVLEADTKGVPLRVNYPYPETKELTQIPPTLLLRLPQLPKEVKYRFVGRNLLLVDTDNALIVDYMLNALP